MFSRILVITVFGIVFFLVCAVLLVIGIILKKKGASENTLRKYIIFALVIFGILNAVIWILCAYNFVRSVLDNKDALLELYRIH
ncbi:MAG: hypothetical protein LBQ91_05390 [Oscillospiraceae bacterium]|nr:hypothetical protein [Oscillospiraceae bacterium]